MSKATILIVEDEAIVAEDLAQKLARLGYEVSGITDLGEEAVVLARERRPDLVLMDISLSGLMDGVEAGERIRRETGLPVVFLTGQADSATLQRAKVTDQFGYILKPFEELELAAHIDRALQQHATEI
jgi:CheY-like chemotaxis protein